ncbi:Hsp70 family protein [Catenuloplanes japonicus]|uniref:Hsp70 family protein n=1 Tax=Catenuloplanes japonicus TaxID=33876 RepID=UPI00068F3C7F|nr:Hsp70 family protein [Catenuloplanes japonicus]
MRADGYRLSVDFGTTSTVGFLASPGGGVRPLLLDASPLLPSAVWAAPDGTLFTGVDAERASMGDPSRFEPNPKRRVGDGAVWLGDREVAVVDVVAAVLGRVAEEARRATGGSTPQRVVLTHPAAWGRARLGVLADAARQAGLGECVLVPEPVAAAAYLRTAPGRALRHDRVLVVYDLGAGTCDVSVVQPDGTGSFEVLASDGLDDVGGLDLDAVVVSLIRGDADAESWNALDWPRTTEEHRARRELWRSARMAKEQLSRHPMAEIHVPIASRVAHVTREEFERAVRPLLDRTAALTVSTVRAAGVPPEQIGTVLLVGGATRVPLAASLLHRTLRLPPAVLDQPELLVAEGALYLPESVSHRDAVAGSPPRKAPDPVTAPRQPEQPEAPTPPEAPERPAASKKPGTAEQAETPEQAEQPQPSETRMRPGAEAGVDGGAGHDPAVPRPGIRRRDLLVRGALGTATAGLAGWLGYRGYRALRTTPDPRPGRLIGSAIQHDAWEVALHPSEADLVATAGADGTIRRWSVTSGRESAPVITGHEGRVTGIDFSPDGKVLVSGGDDQTVRFWDAASGSALGEPLTVYHGTVTCVRFDPTGRYVAAADTFGYVRVWDAVDHSSRRSGGSGDGRLNAVLWYGTMVVTAGVNGRIREYADMADGTGFSSRVAGMIGPADVTCIAAGTTGRPLVGGYADGVVRVWQTPAAPQARLTGHTDAVTAVCCDRQGRFAVTGGGPADPSLRLWDLTRHGDQKQVGAALTGHTGPLRSLRLRAGERELLSVSADGTIRLWSIDPPR